jgi:hypothetical protein
MVTRIYALREDDYVAASLSIRHGLISPTSAQVGISDNRCNFQKALQASIAASSVKTQGHHKMAGVNVPSQDAAAQAG